MPETAKKISRDHQTARGRAVEGAERVRLAERIRSSRTKLGLSQAHLARKLGVSAGAVGKWEIGLGVPATERLATLAEVLDVSLDWLMGVARQAGKPAMTAAATHEDMHLLDEPRRPGVDLGHVVADARQQRWLDENREALADANAFLEQHGLWSDGKRQF